MFGFTKPGYFTMLLPVASALPVPVPVPVREPDLQRSLVMQRKQQKFLQDPPP
jgi:hypothetical protein